MSLVWCPEIGVLVEVSADSLLPAIRYPVSGSEWSPLETTYRLSHASSWELVDSEKTDDRVRELLDEHHVRKYGILLLSALCRPSEDLAARILAHFDPAADRYSDRLIDFFLMAPVKEPSAITALRVLADRLALACAARFFDRLYLLQFPLRILADAWLDLPTDLLARHGLERRQVWMQMGRRGSTRRLVECPESEFAGQWASIVPAHRKPLSDDWESIGQTILLQMRRNGCWNRESERTVSPPSVASVDSDRGRASILGKTVLVVSRDVLLAQKLQGWLRQDFGCDVGCANSYSGAEQELRASGPRSVFLDLRSDRYEEDPKSLFDFLVRQDRRRNPVVSIGCDGYRCEWADLADSTIAADLRLPVDRDQLERVVRHDLVASLRTRTVPTADCRQVQTKHITFCTYTPQVSQILENLTRVAVHDVTILLVGETGTGKTTLARMVHDLSPRAQGRFYALACGALPPELIESELFGHVKGAFTGAYRNKEGKFEIADRGTLLLDEIDCLDQNQQMKLLRVIETGEFERVGCNETQETNARLIAASNVDLKSLVENNQFRPDLYYRLSVLEFKVPPLRERPFDIVPLTLGFVEEFREKHGITIRRIHPEFLQRLRFYDWPGNIRELKNHVGRAVLFSHNGQLTPNDLAPPILEATEHGPVAKRFSRAGNALSEKVASTERELLVRALEEHGQNRTATA